MGILGQELPERARLRDGPLRGVVHGVVRPLPPDLLAELQHERLGHDQAAREVEGLAQRAREAEVLPPRAGNTCRPSKSEIIRWSMSPVSSHDWTSARLIMMLVVRSASCSVCMASSARGTSARICAAAAMMSWESFGLRFWGIVLLPTVPGGTGSSTSPNSCFISV